MRAPCDYWLYPLRRRAHSFSLFSNGVCDATTGLYSDPRQAMCVSDACAYDGGDCVATGSADGLASAGFTAGGRP